jgi:hypothetical protein
MALLVLLLLLLGLSAGGVLAMHLSAHHSSP